jgi:hypothetical protein
MFWEIFAYAKMTCGIGYLSEQYYDCAGMTENLLTSAIAVFKPKLIRQKMAESRMYVFSGWLT